MPPKTIISCLQNILPLFSTNMRHGLKQTNRVLFTNKYLHTLHHNRRQILEIPRAPNCTFVGSYQSALECLRRGRKEGEVVLLVGTPGWDVGVMGGDKVITVEEMCALFPEKVPLSYRNKSNQQIRRKIQKRIGLSLGTEPHIGHILYTGADVAMWDEAIQVIIDHQPSQNIIQYQQSPPQSPSSQFYKLSLTDFLKAVSKCHEIVHYSPLPNIYNFNTDNKQVQWLIQKAVAEQKERYGKVGTVVVDEDLVDGREELLGKYGFVEVQRVDENSALWV